MTETYVLVKGTQKRRRKSGECARPLQTIRNFCVECMGDDITEVKRCTAPKCWLYPLRMGKNPLAKGGPGNPSAFLGQNCRRNIEDSAPNLQSSAPMRPSGASVSN